MITDNDWYQHEWDTVYLDYIKGKHDIKKYYDKTKEETVPGVLKGEGEMSFRHCHTWEFTNFPRCSQRLRTAKFFVEDHTNDKYLSTDTAEMFSVYLRVIPGLYHEDDVEQTMEIIQFEISARKYISPAKLDFEIVVLNNYYEEMKLKKRPSFELEKEAGDEIAKVKDVRWVFRHELMQHMKGRKHLTIRGDITQTVTFDSEKVFKKPEDEDYGMHYEMANNLTDFFNSGRRTDFTLVVVHGDIPVHKFILSLHSKYFEAMMRSKMIEVRKKKAWLDTEFEYDLFYRLRFATLMDVLTFIYSMSAPNIFWNLRDLHMESKRFQIDALTTLTEKEIPEAINVLNVLSYFVMSNRVGYEEFMPQCKDIISKRKKRIVRTAQYEDMIEKYKDVIANFYDIPDLDITKVFCWSAPGWACSTACECANRP